VVHFVVLKDLFSDQINDDEVSGHAVRMGETRKARKFVVWKRE